MRRLTKKKALTLVKELDAFPKVPESYVETTASGGTGITKVTANGRIALDRHLILTTSGCDVVSSVADRVHSHGCAGLPGVLRV